MKIPIFLTIILLASSRVLDAVYDSDNTCRVGDTIRIELEENPSTGYEWILLESILQSSKLLPFKVVDDNFSEDDHSHNLVGVPGTRVIEIECLHEGNGFVHLINARPFEIEDDLEDIKSSSEGFIDLGNYEWSAQVEDS